MIASPSGDLQNKCVLLSSATPPPSHEQNGRDVARCGDRMAVSMSINCSNEACQLLRGSSPLRQE